MITIETSYVTSLNDCNGFAQEDLWYFMQEMNETKSSILCIDKFSVDKKHRNKGVGTQFLKDFCKKHQAESIILVVAGFLKEENEHPTKDELNEKLGQLERFYMSVGFVNANDYIGQYEFNTAYLYNGGIGKELISHLK